MPVLFLLFILVPIIEIAVLIRVGSIMGFWPTLALMLVMGFVGAWLAKQEGRRTFFEIQRSIASGQMPGNEILEGFLIFMGGLLMLTPGFVTDVVGLWLVFPLTRKMSLGVMKRLLMNKIRFKVVRYGQQNAPRYDHHPIRDVSPRRDKSVPSEPSGPLTSL